MARTLVVRDDHEWERYVQAEIIIPDTPNTYGDIMTREAIKEAAFEFARQGYGLDINHDQVDRKGQELVVVESFIARDGDPMFIAGAWVIGMKILDDDLWQMVLDGELNGFSYEALVQMTEVVLQNLRNRQISGVTEPDPHDGHTHPYLVIVDPLNRPVSGGTGVTNGHSHRIVSHTVTEYANDFLGFQHSHRYQVIVGDQGDSNVTGI